MKKCKLLSLPLLLFVSTCAFEADYLPVKSDFYEIKNKSVFYQDDYLSVTVSGKCSRPDLYNLTAKFDVTVQTRDDSLQIDFNDINLVADNGNFFSRYLISGPDGESKKIFRLLPASDYSFSIQGILTDKLLVEFNDNLEGVSLTMNGVSNADNLLNIPVFLFKTDTTVFNIVR